MNKQTYTISWTQQYTLWPEPQLDLTEARAVLARIMSL